MQMEPGLYKCFGNLKAFPVQKAILQYRRSSQHLTACNNEQQETGEATPASAIAPSVGHANFILMHLCVH